jgi:hypothetical protein
LANLKSFNATDNTPATINRMYQNVQEFAAQIDDSDRVAGVLPIRSSAGVANYLVNKDDGYIIVNARGGPMKVVLPVPARQRQAVHVLNGYSTSNTVAVVQADSKAMGNGQSSIALAVNESALMVCDGTAWFRFRG